MVLPDKGEPSNLVRIALTVVVDSFTWASEKHRVAIAIVRLYMPDREVLFGDGVGMLLLVRSIEGIDFLSKHRTFECAACFAFFFNCQAGW